MRNGKALLAAAILIAAVPQIRAQVLSPPEILDPAMRALQEKHFPELKIAAVDITAHNYPYRFYLSRTLDLTEKQELATDQRSIRFAQFKGRTVLQVTGNYFAAYSDQTLDRKQRFQRTYLDVMLPILRATSRVIQAEPEATAIAIEVSHHVRKQVMGNGMERPENLVLIVPREDVGKLAAASGIDDAVVTLSQCNVFVDGEPFAFWGEGTPEKAVVATQVAAPRAEPAIELQHAVAPLNPPAPAAAAPPPPVRDLSAEALRQTQASCQSLLDRIVHELDAQAHFVSYAPPTLIAFRNASYLQLSITTTLAPSDSGSQYRIAALAFDQHVSHLIRPTVALFEDAPRVRWHRFQLYRPHIRAECRLGDNAVGRVLFPYRGAAPLRKVRHHRPAVNQCRLRADQRRTRRFRTPERGIRPAAMIPIAGRWLQRYAVLLAVASLFAIITGTAFTTNEERPLYSLGQSHLAISVFTGILTIGLVVWLSLADKRAWIRGLAWMALAILIVETLLGFIAVPQPPAIRFSHALLAQLFFAITAAIAVFTGLRWRSFPSSPLAVHHCGYWR